jgi:hypothetical protein
MKDCNSGSVADDVFATIFGFKIILFVCPLLLVALNPLIYWEKPKQSCLKPKTHFGPVFYTVLGIIIATCLVDVTILASHARFTSYMETALYILLMAVASGLVISTGVCGIGWCSVREYVNFPELLTLCFYMFIWSSSVLLFNVIYLCDNGDTSAVFLGIAVGITSVSGVGVSHVASRTQADNYPKNLEKTSGLNSKYSSVQSFDFF